MYKIEYSNQIYKNITKLTARNKRLLREVLFILEEYGELPIEYGTHKLKGTLSGLLDSHLDDDLILVWRKTRKTIYLYDIGTHADLFK